jgi:hypothetical protein
MGVALRPGIRGHNDDAARGANSQGGRHEAERVGPLGHVDDAGARNADRHGRAEAAVVALLARVFVRGAVEQAGGDDDCLVLQRARWRRRCAAAGRQLLQQVPANKLAPPGPAWRVVALVAAVPAKAPGVARVPVRCFTLGGRQ